MSATLVANRYAKAFLDAVGKAEQYGAETTSFFNFCDAVAANKELQSLFANVTVKRTHKANIAGTIGEKLKLNKVVVNFLRVLGENGRLDILVDVRQAVLAELDRRTGVCTVELTVAHAVKDEEFQAFQSKMKAFLGTEVRVQTRENAELIAGGIAKVGSTVFDGSVRGQLVRIRKEMVKEN